MIRRLLRLKDVNAAGIADGETLVWDTATSTFIPGAVGGGGVTDHGALTGLADDDHTQYVSRTPALSSRNVVQPSAGDVIAAIVKAHAAQTVDLTQWQTSSGDVKAAINDLGTLEFQRPTGPVAGKVPQILVTHPGNTNHSWAGVSDFMLYEQAMSGATCSLSVWVARRDSDGKVLSYVDAGSESFSGYFSATIQDPDTEALLRFVSMDALFGFYSYGVDSAFDIYADADGSINKLKFSKVGADWMWSIFGAAGGAQQSASSVGALWTALKAYGWLDAGSSAPSLAAASHTHAQSDVTSLTSDLAAKIPNSLVDAKGDILTATADNTPARLGVGTDGHVLTADSAQATGIKWSAAPGIPGFAISKKTTIWRTSGVLSNTAGFSAGVQNQIYAVPVQLRAGTLDRIGTHVGSAQASNTWRLGLYSDNNGYPGSLLADFGTIDASTTGQKTISVSQVVNDGIYWTALVEQGGAAGSTVLVWTNAGNPIGSFFNDSGNIYDIYHSLTYAGNAGALPGTWTATPAGIKGVTWGLALRYSS